MKTIIHKANTRGHFDHGWLKTHHTFSFADYYDPQRVHFGALRVLNDDSIDAGEGFGTHSHYNMEIITIPLSGTIEHRDSMGHVSQLHVGQVQVMSAGTGLRHSEYSVSTDKPTELLQIWVMPEQRNVEPRYQNGSISDAITKNAISDIVYPHSSQAAQDGGTIWIHQQAWFSVAELDRGAKVGYELHNPESYGVYVFVIEGSVNIGGDLVLEKRDGVGITEAQQFDVVALEAAKVLFIEVPFYPGK